MKNFTRVLAAGLTAGFLFFPAVSSAADNYLKVTFKPGVSEKYIKIVNLMTGTKIAGKVNSSVYNLRIPAASAETLKNYSNLFSLIPDVKSIEPVSGLLPANQQLKAGQVIPGVILVKFRKEAKTADIKKLDLAYKTKTELISAELNLYKVKLPASLNVEQSIRLFGQNKLVEYAEADRVMTIQKNKGGFNLSAAVPSGQDLIISFKPGSEELAVNLFNLVYDTKLVTGKTTDSYLFKLPDGTNPEAAIEALKLCPHIMNINISKE